MQITNQNERCASGRIEIVLVFMVIPILASAGCNNTKRSVGKHVRHHVVETVVDQGVTLNQEADPREVVFVLLRAIWDDYEAGDDPAAREAAFDRELAVCAPDYIFSRAVRRSVGRDDAVQRIVWRWAPTLGHYRDDFPATLQDAMTRLKIARSSKTDEATGEIEHARVVLELASPTGNKNASVVAQFDMVREKGYWRVAQVGYVKGVRHLTQAVLNKIAMSAAGTTG